MSKSGWRGPKKKGWKSVWTSSSLNFRITGAAKFPGRLRPGCRVPWRECLVILFAVGWHSRAAGRCLAGLIDRSAGPSSAATRQTPAEFQASGRLGHWALASEARGGRLDRLHRYPLSRYRPVRAHHFSTDLTVDRDLSSRTARRNRTTNILARLL